MPKYYEVYKVLIVAATLSGIYIPSIEKIYGNKRNVKLLKYICILPGITLPVYLASVLKYQIFEDDDIGNKIYGYTIILFMFYVSFSFFSFHYYKKDFERVFELWDSMFQDSLYPEDREELLVKSRKTTNRWLEAFGCCSMVSIGVYFCFMYFKPEKTLNHPSGIPYEHRSPDFELLNTLDLIVCTFGLAALVTFDSTTMALLSLEDAQFEHLKRTLAKIVDTVSVSDSGTVLVKSEEITNTHDDAWKMKKAFEEVEKNLRLWISHHHQIIRFHNEFQKVFQVPLTVKFLVFVLMICLICFLALAGKLSIFEIAFAIAFCGSNYSVFYANVKYADSIIEVAATIFSDAFGKSWYLYPKTLKDAFIIIQMNSHRPVQYLALKKYSLSSNNYLKVLSSAYTLFTFMLQTNRKKIKTLEIRTTGRRL